MNINEPEKPLSEKLLNPQNSDQIIIPLSQNSNQNFNLNNLDRQSLHEQRAMADRNIQQEMANLINRSLFIKIFTAIISITKIILTSVFLNKYPAICNDNSYKVFLILMLIHDIMNVFYVFGYSIYSHFFVNRQTMMQDYEDQLIQNINAQYRNANEPREERNNNDLVENQCKFLSIFKELNKIFYFGILIWGHIILYINSPQCENDGPQRDLILTYLILGYIYIFYPLLIVISLCLCLPCIIFLIFFFGTSSQKPAENELINHLPIGKYHREEIPQNADLDCMICRIDYQENDDIIILPCNNLHFFHEDCIKKWLKINGLCPVCRARLAK